MTSPPARQRRLSPAVPDEDCGGRLRHDCAVGAHALMDQIFSHPRPNMETTVDGDSNTFSPIDGEGDSLSELVAAHPERTAAFRKHGFLSTSPYRNLAYPGPALRPTRDARLGDFAVASSFFSSSEAYISLSGGSAGDTAASAGEGERLEGLESSSNQLRLKDLHNDEHESDTCGEDVVGKRTWLERCPTGSRACGFDLPECRKPAPWFEIFTGAPGVSDVSGGDRGAEGSLPPEERLGTSSAQPDMVVYCHTCGSQGVTKRLACRQCGSTFVQLIDAESSEMHFGENDEDVSSSADPANCRHPRLRPTRPLRVVCTCERASADELLLQAERLRTGHTGPFFGQPTDEADMIGEAALEDPVTFRRSRERESARMYLRAAAAGSVIARAVLMAQGSGPGSGWPDFNTGVSTDVVGAVKLLEGEARRLGSFDVGNEVPLAERDTTYVLPPELRDKDPGPWDPHHPILEFLAEDGKEEQARGQENCAPSINGRLRATAEVWYGWCASVAKGTVRSNRIAIKYYARAARCDNLVALHNLGLFLSDGNRGIEGTEWKFAVSCFRRAAELGDIDCQARLARCYSLGNGVERNPDAALFWWSYCCFPWKNRRDDFDGGMARMSERTFQKEIADASAGLTAMILDADDLPRDMQCELSSENNLPLYIADRGLNNALHHMVVAGKFSWILSHAEKSSHFDLLASLPNALGEKPCDLMYLASDSGSEGLASQVRSQISATDGSRRAVLIFCWELLSTDILAASGLGVLPRDIIRFIVAGLAGVWRKPVHPIGVESVPERSPFASQEFFP